jgi:predicted Zn-dependent protease
VTRATEPLEICERTLGLVSTLVGDDAEAQVTVHTGGSALTRFANSFIHQNMVDQTMSVGLTLTMDGRTASASATSTDDDDLTRLVRSAAAAAGVRPADPAWPGLAPPSAPAPDGHWDDGTAGASPDVRARLVADFIAAADGLGAAGSCETTAVRAAYANSAGQRLQGRSTVATLDGIARSATADGSGRQCSAAVAELDGTATGSAAARLAREGADARDVEPGRYEVVLGPGCVADVLFFLAVYGFNARAVAEGRSFARVGERQFDPALTLWDDATDPCSVGLPFDAEGTPKRRVDLVRAGETVGLAHDRRTAAAAGADSTGHAIEGGESFGAVPGNLLLAPGAATPEELVSGIGHGLLVTDFWYTRVLDPRTQVVTGLTRNGVFMIEDGRVAGPVRNLRFTQSYVDALAPGNVRAVGSDSQLVPVYFGTCAVPSLHLAAWNFTGGSAG